MANIKVTPDVTIYRAGSGSRWTLSAVFFFLMLFMVNALGGAIWLVFHNSPFEALVFFLMFAASGAGLFYVGLYLFFISHAEVRLRADRAMLFVPDWRGPTPMFPYAEMEIPYADVAVVETRSEVYHYFIQPVIVHAASLVRRDGRRVTLGYVRENSAAPAMPFLAIAEQIAGRARARFSHRGVVEANTGWRALLQEEPEWDALELSPERIEEIRAQAAKGRRMGAATVGAVVVLGAIYQIARLYL
jgi:hypothetical protein